MAQFVVFDKAIAGSDADTAVVAGNIEAINDHAYTMVTDGTQIVALRVDAEGAHIITSEVIEAVAARYLKTFEQGDRVPAWLENTDAYDEWAEETETEAESDRLYGSYAKQVRDTYYAGQI